MQGDTASASTWSRRSGSTQTLEQETVDTLNNAGYEAYHVTADNYESLEADLYTDFGGMGLDPEGSYIVVISGEDQDDGASGNQQNSARISPEINFEEGPTGSGSAFHHTYGDTTYLMRYMTVTAADNNQLGQTSEVDFFEDMSADEMLDALSLPLAIISNVPVIGTPVEICTLIMDVLPDVKETQPASFEYRAGSNWTILYVQVKNQSDGSWSSRSSIEYVTLRYFTDYTYYNPSSNQYEQVSSQGSHKTLYSKHYNDSQWLKDTAAQAVEYGPYTHFNDKVEMAEYEFNGKIVIAHYRPEGIDS